MIQNLRKIFVVLYVALNLVKQLDSIIVGRIYKFSLECVQIHAVHYVQKIQSTNKEFVIFVF